VADVRLTQTYVEALTQNPTSVVRVTQTRTEALLAPVEFRLTQAYVEVLTQNPTAEVRVTQHYVDVLSSVPHDLYLTQQYAEVLVAVAPLADVRLTNLFIEQLNTQGLPITDVRLTNLIVEAINLPVIEPAFDADVPPDTPLTWVEFHVIVPPGLGIRHMAAPRTVKDARKKPARKKKRRTVR
jgi:hypothetical protein